MTDDFNPDYVSEHLAPGVPRTDRFGRRVRTMAETKLARIETDRPRRETGSVRSMRAGSASDNTTPSSQDTDQ